MKSDSASVDEEALTEYRWDVFIAHDVTTYVPLQHTFQLFNCIPRAEFPNALQFGVKILVDNAFRLGAPSYEQLTPVAHFLPSTESDVYDNLSVWSGCGTHVEGKDLLFYTAVSRQELAAAADPSDSRSLGMIPQRMFVAASEDGGLHWERCQSDPLIDLNSGENIWYERSSVDNAIEGQAQANSACRDPFVFQATVERNLFNDDATELESGKYYMLFTGRVNSKYAVDGSDIHFRGCIGVASANRAEGPYHLRAPILNLGVFGDMELPHLVNKDGKTYMFFSVQDKCIDGTNSTDGDFAKNLGLAPDVRCSYGYVFDALTSSWIPMNDRGGHIESPAGIYGIRIYQDPDRPAQYGARGFFLPLGHPREDGYKEFTMTPNLVVDWGEDDHIRISLPNSS